MEQKNDSPNGIYGLSEWTTEAEGSESLNGVANLDILLSDEHLHFFVLGWNNAEIHGFDAEWELMPGLFGLVLTPSVSFPGFFVRIGKFYYSWDSNEVKNSQYLKNWILNSEEVNLGIC
jgi:hypothetical protein